MNYDISSQFYSNCQIQVAAQFNKILQNQGWEENAGFQITTLIEIIKMLCLKNN